MLKLSSKITIEGAQVWEFTAVSEVEITQDVDSLTDTCQVHIPRKVQWVVSRDGHTVTQPPIKRGDRITVCLGYDGVLSTRFVGYIRSVCTKVPVVLKCEDAMYLLKTQKAVPKGWRNASLKEVLEHLLQGTGIAVELMDKDLDLGAYRIVKPTVSEELQELKEKYMLSSYFRFVGDNNVLYVGLKYPTDHRTKHIFKWGKNIIDEDLEYRNKDDIRARVQAESFGAGHKKTTIEVGDKDGDLIKIRIDGLSEEELKKYAEKTLERYKQDGFKGSFDTFGMPEVNKCDMVDITAEDGNQGTYLVKKNEISFGTSGYRQKIELGPRIGY
jgi:hypothetical protein|nr:MAG TPA: tail protein [Caudoviricetes sp.]